MELEAISTLGWILVQKVRKLIGECATLQPLPVAGVILFGRGRRAGKVHLSEAVFTGASNAINFDAGQGQQLWQGMRRG